MPPGLGDKATSAGYHQLGVSRPPIEVENLPTPEKAFKVGRIGFEELILFVIGPSLIALGISPGSGEWLLGPIAVAQYGFKGIGWIIIVSAVLQIFYNVEPARFTVSTGEPAVAAFGRAPPGYLLWVPLALFSPSLCILMGRRAVNAGVGLFSFFTGRPYLPGEFETAGLPGIALLFITFWFGLLGQEIESTIELVLGASAAFERLPPMRWREEREKIVAAGCDDFVRKPCREEEIIEVVAGHLGVSCLYEWEQERMASVEQRAAWRPEQFAALPADLRISLHQASIGLDPDRILVLIEEIGVLDASIGGNDFAAKVRQVLDRLE
jgi:hypothetical protein